MKDLVSAWFCLAILAQAACVFGAAIDGRAPAPKVCDLAQSVVSKFRGSATLSSACNSLFGTPTPPSRTVTATSTKTITVAPSKVTRTITREVTTKITSYEIFYDIVYTTEDGGIYTSLDEYFVYTTTTVTSSYRNAKRGALEARATPAAVVNGIPRPIISTACSCLFPSPTAATVTSTTTVPVTKGRAETTRTTITETATDTELVFTATERLTLTERTFTTVTSTTTHVRIGTHVACAGTNPTPSITLQFVDTEPTKTDKFNLKYAKLTPLPFAEENMHDFDIADTPAGAGKFHVDCVGRLVSTANAPPYGLQDFYANIDFYSPGFQPIRWLRETTYLEKGYTAVTVQYDGQFLFIYADTAAVGRLDKLVTVPIYYDGGAGGRFNFVALVKEVDNRPPAKTPFRFKVIL